MRAASRPDRRRATKRAAPVTLALLVLVTLTTLVTACGGVEGTYKLAEGDDAMKDFTLTLGGDEFTLAGPNPLGGDDVELKGVYTVDGDKISLTMGEGENAQESEVGTIDGDKLVFEDVTWQK